MEFAAIQPLGVVLLPLDEKRLRTTVVSRTRLQRQTTWDARGENVDMAQAWIVGSVGSAALIASRWVKADDGQLCCASGSTGSFRKPLLFAFPRPMHCVRLVYRCKLWVMWVASGTPTAEATHLAVRAVDESQLVPIQCFCGRFH